MLNTLLPALGALLVAASYAGLCAALRVRFALNRFVAPCAVSCCVIVALMLAGMAGALEFAVYALYALGLAGLVYAYGVRRARPEWALILGLAAACALLLWRYYPCRLWRMDDFSHWGQAARHLLENDRFPDGRDTYIYFQSYPLGSACFIYYLCKPVSHAEGLWLFAQSALYLTLFLPVFALADGRRTSLALAAALFCALFGYCFLRILLLVDLLLAFFGIGIAASIAAARDDLRAAAAAALPGIVAVALIKNSGLFFSLASALLLLRTARRCGLRGARLRALAAAAILLPAAAYLLWTLRIRLCFPAAFASKHAVSLTAYAAQLQEKGLDTIRQIAAAQLGALAHPDGSMALALPLMLLLSLALLAGGVRLPAPERRALRNSYLFIVCAYLLWYVMIFFMYVFSMPEEEAVILASFSRYNGTGLVYAAGLAAILLLDMIRAHGFLPRPLLRAAGAVSLLGAAAALILALWPGQANVLSGMIERDSSYTPLRAELRAAVESYGLQPRGRYLMFYEFDEGTYDRTALYTYYNAKYELETGEIYAIVEDPGNPGHYYAGTRWDKGPIESVPDYVREMIGGCDAFLLLHDSPEFEALIAPVLAEYADGTPVYRAYELPVS